MRSQTTQPKKTGTKQQRQHACTLSVRPYDLAIDMANTAIGDNASRFIVKSLILSKIPSGVPAKVHNQTFAILPLTILLPAIQPLTILLPTILLPAIQPLTILLPTIQPFAIQPLVFCQTSPK